MYNNGKVLHADSQSIFGAFAPYLLGPTIQHLKRKAQKIPQHTKVSTFQYGRVNASKQITSTQRASSMRTRSNTIAKPQGHTCRKTADSIWGGGIVFCPYVIRVKPANNYLHPMRGESSCSLGGGGFQRTVCQLVDCMFSKWSVAVASSTCSTTPSKMTRGSLQAPTSWHRRHSQERAHACQ